MGLIKSSRVVADSIHHSIVGLALDVIGEDFCKSKNHQRRQAWWKGAVMLREIGVGTAVGELDCSIQILGEWFRKVSFMLLYSQMWTWESNQSTERVEGIAESWSLGNQIFSIVHVCVVWTGVLILSLVDRLDHLSDGKLLGIHGICSMVLKLYFFITEIYFLCAFSICGDGDWT